MITNSFYKYISLGSSCHPAGNLRLLGVRKFALPFDWLLTTPEYVLEYVNDLINTNFQKFTKDLKYNKYVIQNINMIFIKHIYILLTTYLHHISEYL